MTHLLLLSGRRLKAVLKSALCGAFSVFVKCAASDEYGHGGRVVLLACRSRMARFDLLLPGLATEPENRLSAIADFTFNLGAGRLQTSTLRRRLNQRDWEAAATELRRWVYCGGKVLPGLVARREAEIRPLEPSGWVP